MSFRQFLANESRKSKYQYSSLLVGVPDDLADTLISWGYDNVPNESLFTDAKDPTFGREDDTHITLIYGIHTDDVDEVARLFDGEQPFEVALGTVAVFDRSEKFDVLIVGVESDDLHRLNSKMRRSLELTESYPRYVPHITIAYLRKGKADQYVGDTSFKGEKFSINKVYFSSKMDVKTPIKLGIK